MTAQALFGVDARASIGKDDLDVRKTLPLSRRGKILYGYLILQVCVVHMMMFSCHRDLECTNSKIKSFLYSHER